MPQGLPPNITVTLPCPECGPVVLSAADVAVVCIGDVASDVSYACPRCGRDRSLSPRAESLSLLHRAGVRVVGATGERRNVDQQVEPGEVGPQEIEPARQVVSLRVLLDQPDFLSRLASTAAADKPRVPPTTAG